MLLMRNTNVMPNGDFSQAQAERIQFLADLAEAFYLDELTQMEVADRFQLARPTVSRLLAEARQKGVIEFKINRAFQRDTTIAQRIVEAFGVGRVDVVVLPERKTEKPYQAFGRFAAEVVHGLLAPQSVFGITLGRAVAATVDGLSLLSPLPIKVVQLCGSVGADDPTLDAHAIVRKLAQAYGCEGAHLFAPFIVETAEVRDSLRKNPTNRNCLDLARKADLALVGIGSVDTIHSALYRGGHVSEAEIRRLQQRGAIGDVGGFSIDAEGQVVDEGGAFFISGIALADFLRIGRRVATATGAQKAAQIAAALRGRMVTHLITDQATARALLEQG
jgi:DNA-binding transcriptional regulator LsrR (DeoR family)